MASNFFSMLRELFVVEPAPDPSVAKISEAIERLSEARHALLEEIALTVERLSDDINRCLTHQSLRLEWEERVRRLCAVDSTNSSGLGSHASEQASLHRRRVEECRESATREEEVARALEKRLAVLDNRLERIVRERDMFRSTGELSRSRARIAQALSELGAATGLEFLEALEIARVQAEQELALSEAHDEAEDFGPGPATGPARRRRG